MANKQKYGFFIVSWFCSYRIFLCTLYSEPYCHMFYDLSCCHIYWSYIFFSTKVDINMWMKRIRIRPYQNSYLKCTFVRCICRICLSCINETIVYSKRLKIVYAVAVVTHFWRTHGIAQHTKENATHASTHAHLKRKTKHKSKTIFALTQTMCCSRPVMFWQTN